MAPLHAAPRQRPPARRARCLRRGVARAAHRDERAFHPAARPPVLPRHLPLLAERLPGRVPRVPARGLPADLQPHERCGRRRRDRSGARECRCTMPLTASAFDTAHYGLPIAWLARGGDDDDLESALATARRDGYAVVFVRLLEGDAWC